MVHRLPTQAEATKYFHRQIYTSIKKRDAESAEFLMDAHLSYVQNDIREGKELSSYEDLQFAKVKSQS
jgi:DNA-binding FadR family transcriptional regulator